MKKKNTQKICSFFRGKFGNFESKWLKPHANTKLFVPSFFAYGTNRLHFNGKFSFFIFIPPLFAGSNWWDFQKQSGIGNNKIWFITRSNCVPNSERIKKIYGHTTDFDNLINGKRMEMCGFIFISQNSSLSVRLIVNDAPSDSNWRRNKDAIYLVFLFTLYNM